MDAKEQQILEEFRKMVLAEKDLNPCTESRFLIKFLRTRRYDCNKSLRLLRNYYKLRFDNAHLYKNYSPKAPNMLTMWDTKFTTLMPVPDKHNRKIVISHVGKWNPLTSGFDDLFIAFQIAMEALIADEEETQRVGVILVMDMNDIGFAHAKQCVPSNIKKILALFEDSFPLFFHELHLINQNAIFKMIFSLALPFFSNSMRKKIVLHGRNLDSLHQHISPCLLPSVLGGTAQCRDHEENLQMLFRHEEYLLMINEFGYKQPTNVE